MRVLCARKGHSAYSETQPKGTRDMSSRSRNLFFTCAAAAVLAAGLATGCGGDDGGGEIDAATLSDIADKTPEDGTPLPALPITLAPPETRPASLTVTATSGNTGLVPASGLVLGGSGASRTLTVTPAASGTGTAVITVKVS